MFMSLSQLVRFNFEDSCVISVHLVKCVNLNYSEDLGLKCLGQELFVVTDQ